jgi:hypothetical protein
VKATVTIRDEKLQVSEATMDRPICDLLPIARPGLVFCARKPISYGRYSGARFASRDHPSCCLRSGAAFHREYFRAPGARDWIVLCHPNSKKVQKSAICDRAYSQLLRGQRQLHLPSWSGLANIFLEECSRVLVDKLESSSRRIMRQVSNERAGSDSVRTTTAPAGTPTALGLGRIAKPARSETK